ncbi:MAG: UDP-N-acetylmuramoyl-L-alanine--D-glutamate ligase [Sphingomicrobium sp.]
MITARAFAGKRYAVYGLARSGLATVAALLASGGHVTAWDAKEEARDKLLSLGGRWREATEGAPPQSAALTAPPEGERLAIANLDEADLTQFDSLVVTPGLPLNRHPIAQRAREAGLEIIGDIELFARARPELPPHKVVGITGTNGKSTTTALVHHILKTAGVPTTMGGNIGLPILAQDPLPEGGVYVLELSSYQIDLTQSLDCDVAVLLNITPDHLDRYDSFKAYAQSKLRLFDMLGPGHAAVVGNDLTLQEDWVGDYLDDLHCSNHRIEEYRVLMDTSWDRHASFANGALSWNGRRLSAQAEWPQLQGPHNAWNASAAATACLVIGLDEGAVAEGLVTYSGLPHRMERVRERNGVLFVNDSKATNPTATAPALAAFPAIRWLLGGQAKTDNLDECAPYFGHVRSAYTIGEAAEMFTALLSPHMPVKNCGKLDEAVRQAAQDAEAGDTVLLSPACASFDQFRDFEDRGQQFKALVGAL